MVARSRRDVLLEAAARVLAEEGPKALSTRRLAAEVGASTMAVYTDFGSKSEVVRELFREGFRRLDERLRRVKVTDDPLRDLASLAVAYRQNALANPHLYNVMFGHSGELFVPDQSDLELSLGTLQILEDAVARAVHAGRIECEPSRGARQLWAAAHGVVSLELVDRADWAETYVALMRTLVVGLGADAAAVTRLRF